MSPSRTSSAVVLLAAGVVACARPAPPPAPVDNRAVAQAPVTVTPGEPLGLLALVAAPARAEGIPYWVPIAPGAGALVPAPATVPAGESRVVVSAAGPTATLTAGEATTVTYGCDDGSLAVTPLGGELPPGLAWVLPASPPPAWSPAAVPLVVDGASRDEARWRAGRLTVTQTRTSDAAATLVIALDGAEVVRRTDELYFMDGAEPSPLDLTEDHRPGVPTPAAVFAIAPDGPYLVVLDESGFEGAGFTATLVAPDGARPVEELGLGVYFCAF